MEPSSDGKELDNVRRESIGVEASGEGGSGESGERSPETGDKGVERDDRESGESPNLERSEYSAGETAGSDVTEKAGEDGTAAGEDHVESTDLNDGGDVDDGGGGKGGGGKDAGGEETGGEEDDRVGKYDRFKKVEKSEYDRVNDFLRKRTYVTAREWAIARLCTDFRTETGVEMTTIGENLPELVPFMSDTYTPQAVNQARSSFVEKVRKSGATFLYGSMSGFFTPEELDEMMYEISETARFLVEVEGAEIPVEREMEVEDKISEVMRDIQESSDEVRGREEENEEDGEEVTCPDCGHTHSV
ncbi:MAG: DUF5806 family protein [Halobacteria archaeon]